jgi:hypothetical protein
MLPPTAKHARTVGQLTPKKSSLEPTCCIHVAPPSVVATMVPALPGAATPTAKHVVMLGQLTPKRGSTAGDVCAVQVLPPFVVATIVAGELPLAPVTLPTAKQVDGLGQLTLRRGCVVPEVCVVQLRPPLAVATIVPFAPTATQSLAFAQLTPSKSWVVINWRIQVTPASTVVRMVPPLPTATQVLALGQLTAFSGLPCSHCQGPKSGLVALAIVAANGALPVNADATSARASPRLIGEGDRFVPVTA